MAIYRFNALHRKADVACKVCVKRERDELELKKRQAIIEALPDIIISKISVVTSTSVDVDLVCSVKSEGQSKVFESLVVSYSDNVAMANISKVVVNGKDFESSDHKTVRIEGLVSGHEYYFTATIGHKGCHGQPSKPFSLLVGTSS